MPKQSNPWLLCHYFFPLSPKANNGKCQGAFWKSFFFFFFLFSVTKCFHYGSCCCKMKKLHLVSSTTLWWLFRWCRRILNLSNFLFMRSYDWISIWSTSSAKNLIRSKLKHQPIQFIFSQFIFHSLFRYLGSNGCGVVKVKATIVLDATNVTVSQQFCENHWSWPNIHGE